MQNSVSSPSLVALGWTPARARESGAVLGSACVPARVLAQHRDRYVVGMDTGDVDAVLRGRVRAEGLAAHEHPAVGDWVAVRRHDATLALIEAVLPRTGAFVRKAAGDPSIAQVVAANVDVAFIVTSMDGDLNARRLERYATLAWESGALPVIVLTKCDLATDEDLAAARITVGEAAPGVDVAAVSAIADAGLDAIASHLPAGRTGVLMGSSGVGKSTLVNRLSHDDRLRTAPVLRYGRGRHTTTHRELVRLPGGAMLIDTPGMRELQLWSDGAGVDAVFAEIDDLARGCRFRDCAHDAEPGCHVRQALARGALTADRLASYHALRREVAWLARRADVRMAAEAKQREKLLHRAHYANIAPKNR